VKIAHFSDLHFSHFVKNPLQFLSKTWIGNANLTLKRGKVLQPVEPKGLIETLNKIQPDVCVISGDFTTTSQPEEFKAAKHFVNCLKEAGFHVLNLPGNHDHYTKKAFKKKVFYDYLFNDHRLKSHDLKTEGFEIYDFKEATLILMDLSCATPWFTAYGIFNHKLEENLKEVLLKIPMKKPLIFSGHFPILDDTDCFSKSLKRSKALFELVKTHSNCFYLHGHNHHFTVLKTEFLTQIDSGSLSDVKKGTFSVLDTESLCCTPYYRMQDTFKAGAPQ